MKKKFIISIIIIMLLLSIILINNPHKIEDKHFLSIKKQIEEQNNLLIYITNTDESCYLCKDVASYIDYYKETYNLNFITYDKNINTKEDYEKLEDYLKIEHNYIIAPAVIIVKDKKWAAIVNEMNTEDNLKQFLIDTEFLSKEQSEIETPLTPDTFKIIYSSNQPKLIFFYTIDNENTENYDYRKKLFSLSNQYNFKYNTVYLHLGGGLEIVDTINKETNQVLSTPSLVIVQNNKVIDKTNTKNTSKIIRFLKKNNMIT